jgi:hypothetical protein
MTASGEATVLETPPLVLAVVFAFFLVVTLGFEFVSRGGWWGWGAGVGWRARAAGPRPTRGRDRGQWLACARASANSRRAFESEQAPTWAARGAGAPRRAWRLR